MNDVTPVGDGSLTVNALRALSVGVATRYVPICRLNDEVSGASGCRIGRERPTTAARGFSIFLLDERDGVVRHAEDSLGGGWYRFAGRMRGEGTAARRAWREAYVRRLVVADAACATVAALIAYFGRFGAETAT